MAALLRRQKLMETRVRKSMGMKQKPYSSFKRLLTNSALVLLTSASFTLAMSQDAYAQRAQRNNNQQEAPAEGRQFNAKTGAIVLAAQEFLTAENFGAAIGELNKALGLPDLNAYERGVINQMMGAAYYELDQISPAINAFEAAISSGGLLPNEAATLRSNIAQLLIADEQYVRGAEMLEQWSREGGQLKPAHVELLISAWTSAQRWNRALPWAERWFNNANPKERKHFDLLSFIYNNLDMPAKQSDIVKQMINRWPEDKNLWGIWASLLMQGNREAEAFEVNKLQYLGGAFSSEAELLKVVQYYSYYDMPYEAAGILQREMNSGKISQNPERLVQLSELFLQSREYEKAIPVLEQAAVSAGTAKLYADLGDAYKKRSQCESSEKAFRKAMDLGFDRGKAWAIIATCRYDEAANAKGVSCPKVLFENEVTPALDKLAATSPWYLKREAAIKAYDNVPLSSSEAKNSRTWKSFIKNEKDAILGRCKFEVNEKKSVCYKAIKGAYDNVVFEGTFKLGNDACLVYKPGYDEKYRKQDKEEDKK